MAQRELQVTALQPAARAMDTYVRPEFERNQQAISRLTQSIEKTDTDRAIKNAQLDAVSESLAGDSMKDVHNLEAGSSTHPAYVATRLENRGFQFSTEAAPQVLAAYKEFQNGASSDGSDLAPFLESQFAPLLEQLNGKGGQFLLAGASKILQETRNQILAAHPAFLDGRAMEETISNMSLRVDSIVHQAPTVNEDGTTAEPMGFYARIDAMNQLAVDFEATTPIKKGAGNKIIFESLLSMAKGADPEAASRYLHMARLVKYSAGKDGAVRPEAWEAVTAAEEFNDRRLAAKTAVEAKAAADAATKLKTDTMGDFISQLSANQGTTALTPEYLDKLQAADISPEKALATMVAVNDLTGGRESQQQLDAWNDFAMVAANNRYNPNMMASYEQILEMVIQKKMHPSRIEEAQRLLKTLETASPLVESKTNTAPRNLFVASMIEQEEEYTVDGKQKKAALIKAWDAEMDKLIAAHYEVPEVKEGETPAPLPVKPTTTQLQAMVTHVEGLMYQKHEDKVVETKKMRTGRKAYTSEIAFEVERSRNRKDNDGKITAFWFNTSGTKGKKRSFMGNMSAADIQADIMPGFRRLALTYPMLVLEESHLKPEDSHFVGMTVNEVFDIKFGPTAFATFFDVYGNKTPTEREYKEWHTKWWQE